MDYTKILIYVLVMVLGIMLYSLLQNYMISLDTSTWSFMGHVEAAAILAFMPLLFLLALIVIPIYFIVQEAED